MSIADVKWTSSPLVGVSMNPIRGPHATYYGFCDLAVVILYPDGNTETVVDCRTRCIPATDDIRRLGEFTAEETKKYNLFGDYARDARDVGDLIKTISVSCKGCIPLAINVQLCKTLLHRSVRIAEASATFDKKDVFVLRERSNWIDLGLWRINTGAERFSVHPTPPRERLLEAFARLPSLIDEAKVSRNWFPNELFKWQGGLIPF